MRGLQTGVAGQQIAGRDEDLKAEVEKAVQEWLALPCMPMDSDPGATWRDLIKFHSAKAYVRYLAPFALKYLVIPGASGTVERVWSNGRRVLTYGRHALSSSRFNQLVRLKHNLPELGLWPPAPISL